MANGEEGREGEISWPCEKREKLAVGSFGDEVHERGFCLDATSRGLFK